MIQIDENFDGRTVELSVGDKLQLGLKENPTTGFGWVVESMAGPVCSLDGDQFEGTPTARGSGGVHLWHLSAKQKGVGKISLSYRRKWEEKAPSQTFSVAVHVT